MKNTKTISLATTLLVLAAFVFNGNAAQNETAKRPVEEIDAIITSFPADTYDKAEAAYKQILKGGSETVKELCSRVAPLSAGNDVPVRFAVHGVVNYAAKHSSGKERRAVALALEETLNAATNDDIKDFMLEQLRFVADKSDIPAISKHLLTASTASRAAIIMVNIGGRDGEKALSEALTKAEGICVTAIIKALGDVGSTACISECIARLNATTDPVLQRTIVYTLSRSGSLEAGKAIKSRLSPAPSGIHAEEMISAYLDFAEHLSAKGKDKEAASIAAELVSKKTIANASARCRAVAILGADKDSSTLPVLIAALDDPDHSVRAQAALQIAGLKGKITKELIAVVQNAKGNQRAALLDTLSRRSDFKDTALLGDALKADELSVRIAALEGLRRIGNADAARTLFTFMEKCAEEDRTDIQVALKRFSDKSALAEVASKLCSNSPVVREVAVLVLTEQRAKSYIKEVLPLTADTDEKVVRAAFGALAVMAGEQELSELVSSALKSENNQYRKSVADTVASAAPRLNDKAKLAQQLISVAKDSDAARSIWAISMLPAVAGTTALAEAISASSSTDAGKREAGIRALAAWPEVSALPILMDISAKSEAKNIRVIAFRGAVRLVRESDLPANKRLETYSQAIKAAPGADEIRLVLSGLSEMRATGAMELIIPLLEREDIRQEAAMAIARIACPKDGSGPALPSDKGTELHKACEMIKDKDLKAKFLKRLPKQTSSVSMNNTAVSEAPKTPPCASTAESPKTDADGFSPLFNGKDLTGWIGDTKGYIAEDGKIVCKPGGNLYTAKQYANFIFKFEFKLTPGANNGLGIRTPSSGNSAYQGMELQILDDSADKYKTLQPYQYHGSIYGIVPSKRGHQKPVGEWNREEVIADGSKIKVILNGTIIIDADLSKITQTDKMHDLKKHPGLHNPSGHIGFLGHGSVVEFRNIAIKELATTTGSSTSSSAETNGSQQPPSGFTAIFNGKDLAGWKGLLAGPNDNPIKRGALSAEALEKAQTVADENMRSHWKVENGMFVFDGKGRSICTMKDYKDFEMLVDWKILANGDSGIYLRGSPQVQIWDAAKHPEGSGGLYNNQRNPNKPSICADKPVGEWNTFRIRMIGEKVTVHLNDKLVLDNVVMENYWDRKQPIFPSGQIELQNHGNTLYFRNIFIKEL
ncbi:MAG: hypothetical protein A2283_10325 [Lentisphaerae bacterium RIFOXYA12_FULL_48_11]|nr:MAG: hypothetical protein A2283_10325 [Lentisphaerae bacterium RIFOXYA12_FULL_48_11]